MNPDLSPELKSLYSPILIILRARSGGWQGQPAPPGRGRILTPLASKKERKDGRAGPGRAQQGNQRNPLISLSRQGNQMIPLISWARPRKSKNSFHFLGQARKSKGSLDSLAWTRKSKESLDFLAGPGPARPGRLFSFLQARGGQDPVPARRRGLTLPPT